MKYQSIDINRCYARVIKEIMPFCQTATPDEVYKGKRRYDFNKEGEQLVFVIEEGDYFVKRRQDDKVIELITSPSVIGFLPALREDYPIYLERIDYGKISYITLKNCMRIIFSHQMMGDVLYILSQRFTNMIYFISDNNGDATKEVCNAITRLQNLPDHIKKRFSALSLIGQTTHLSKSSISRVLKKLQDDGVLSLDKGHLL